MNLTDEQRAEFEKAAEPLITFIKSNCHPHVTAIVDDTAAELLEGVACVRRADSGVLAEH